MTRSSSLDSTFAALADPTRRAILARLADGPANVGELARPFAISLPAISRQLGVLADAGLILREKHAQERRCRLAPNGLDGASSWIENMRAFWEARFDALERHLDETRKVRNARRKRR